MPESLSGFFEGDAKARQLYEPVASLINDIGELDVCLSKSQIAFRRNRTFAILWRPGRYLSGQVAPLVLTLSMPRHDHCDRWKQVVKVSANRFTHHL